MSRKTTPVVAAKPGWYRVQPGDTLIRIALEHGLDYRDIARWNNLAVPSLIYAGSTLRLTPLSADRGVQGEAAAARGIGDRGSADGEDDSLPDAWLWPVRGRIIADFNEAEGRKGIDIAAPFGTAVLASAAGRVVYVGDGLRGYGKLIIIKHNKALLSAYAHQSRLLVKEGERVAQGQQIGEVGDSDAERAKLHFEIREHGKPVSPLDYLPS